MNAQDIRKSIRIVPLFGGVADCSIKEHWNTITELLAGIFWSMLPIWVGTYVLYITDTSTDGGVLHTAFRNALGTGELFIYAAAFLAPIFYVALHDPPGAGRFPSKLEHAVLTAIVTVFAAVSYGLQKSGHQLNTVVLGRLSLWFFWIAVLLVYLATLYHNHRLPSGLPEKIKSQEEQFVQEYQEHRK